MGRRNQEENWAWTIWGRQLSSVVRCFWKLSPKMMWKTRNDGVRQKEVFLVQSDMNCLFFSSLSPLLSEKDLFPRPLSLLSWCCHRRQENYVTFQGCRLQGKNMLFPSSWRAKKEKEKGKQWSGKIWWQADVPPWPNVQTWCQAIATASCLRGSFQREVSYLLLLHCAPLPGSFCSQHLLLALLFSQPPPAPLRQWGMQQKEQGHCREMSDRRLFLPQTLTGEHGPQDPTLTLSENVPTSLATPRLYQVVKGGLGESWKFYSTLFPGPSPELSLWNGLHWNFREVLQCPVVKQLWSYLTPICKNVNEMGSK